MQLSARTIKLIIRLLFKQAAAHVPKISFRDALLELAESKFKITMAGKVLVGTSRAGLSVTYTLPNDPDITEGTIFWLIGWLLDLVDELAPLEGDELEAALLARFPSVRSFGPDFSKLRL